MEFRLPDYGPTVSTVSLFREKIVRLDRYLISAYITLWSVPEVIWLSTSIKTSLRGHEGTARRGKGWWLAWQAAGKIGNGGRKTWRDSWRIWKGRCEWWRWEGFGRFEIKAFWGRSGNVTRAKACLSKVWWPFLHLSRYRHAFARTEAPYFGLASTIYSQRRWKKSNEEYSFMMYYPQQ